MIEQRCDQTPDRVPAEMALQRRRHEADRQAWECERAAYELRLEACAEYVVATLATRRERDRYRRAWRSATGRAVALRDELAQVRAELAECRRAYDQVLQVLRGDTP